MKKRFRFLSFVCFLVIAMSMTSCESKDFFTFGQRFEYVECSTTIPKDVLIIAEFGAVFTSYGECLSLGVISFKFEDKLYGIGHESPEITEFLDFYSNESPLTLAVYKILPEFSIPYGDSPGFVYSHNYNGEVLGEVLENINDGLIISPSDIDTTKYLNIPIATSIYSGDAEIWMRDNKGALYSYEIAIQITTQDGEKVIGITVTDDNLLNMTNGIIPGMSGSPIIQDGNIIGVVTNVYNSKQDQGKYGFGKIIWDIDNISN